MSEHRLKDLLDEMVEDVPVGSVPRIDAAWTDARRRVRRRAGLVTIGAAAALVVAGAIAVDSQDPSADPAPATPDPAPSQSVESPTAQPTDLATGTYDGNPVWWAPEEAAEASLPWTDSPVPRGIDLTSDVDDVTTGVTALAVFAVYDAESYDPRRFVVLTTDGEVSNLPAERIKPNRDEAGNGAAILPFEGGLSPDGQHAFFAQQSSLEVYAFDTATWTTIDTPDWAAEAAAWMGNESIWVPSGPASQQGRAYSLDGQTSDDLRITLESPELAISPDDQAYGVWADLDGMPVAGSYFFAGPVSGGDYSNPEGIVAEHAGERSVLAVSIMAGRSKGCCPVVGWLDTDRIAYRSGGRVLAWTVGSDVLARVTEIYGLGQDEVLASTSWATENLR